MNTILIGKITKVNGFEGAMTVKTDRLFSGKIPETGPVFLAIDGRPVPFFVEYSEALTNDLFRVKFEDYHSADKVKEFVGCTLFITTAHHTESYSSKQEDLTGFMLESATGPAIGRISEILENPGQYLLKVTGDNGKEYLVPLHEDLIISIHPDERKIIMDLPEGLTDLNS